MPWRGCEGERDRDPLAVQNRASDDKLRQEGGFLVAALSGGQRLNEKNLGCCYLFLVVLIFFRGWEAAFQGRSLEDAGSRSRASTQNGFERGGGDGS